MNPTISANRILDGGNISTTKEHWNVDFMIKVNVPNLLDMVHMEFFEVGIPFLHIRPSELILIIEVLGHDGEEKVFLNNNNNNNTLSLIYIERRNAE